MGSPQLWEKQDGEPDDWFDRFQLFKLLGSGRSLLAAYNSDRSRKGQSKSNSAPPAWRNASKKWQWVERSTAWDRRQQQSNDQRYERSNRRWEKRLQELRDRQWDLAEKLMERAEKMLESPLYIEEFAEDDSGRHVTLQIPAKWTFRDVAHFMEVSNRLARFATDADHPPELEALKTLVNAGWIPPEILERAGDQLDGLKEQVKSSFYELKNGEEEE